MRALKLLIIAVASASPFILVTSSQADTILVSFCWSGQQTTAAGWNNVTSSNAGVCLGVNPNGSTTFNLINNTNGASGISLVVTSPFDNSNVNGSTTTTAGYPGTATGGSLYGNVENFNGVANALPVMSLSGFNPLNAYTFKFYASRNSGTGDNRDTRYSLTGNSTAFIDLNPATNVNNIAAIGNFSPNSSGNINLSITPGPANTSAYDFVYLGVLEIDYTPLVRKTTSVFVGSSENPSTNNDSVIFAAAVQTNAVTAGDATGNVIFEINNVAYSTNALFGGVATVTNSALLSGTNTITAEYAGDNQYLGSTNDLVGGQVAVSIGIAPTITSLPIASAISYGQTLTSSLLTGGSATNANAGVSVPGNFVFNTPALAPNAGTTNADVTFMPTTPGYISVSANIPVFVNRTTPSLTLVASSVVYGQTLASASLSGSAAINTFNSSPAAGSFAFAAPSIAPNLGSTNVDVTFTPSDTADYNSATNTVTVSVSKGSIVVFGSSVALGVGSSGYIGNTFTNGSYVNGYAALLTGFLTPQGWSVTNISIAGQDTSDGLARFSSALSPLSPNYVWIGYSLWNEGLGGATDPAGIVTTFTSNLTNIISECRNSGFYPVSGLNYPNNNYTASEYAYLKSANLAINSWNVPSINFLGALDNGNGQWINGYWYDALHPNDAGHKEMFYSFVPTLFDAIAAGKTNSPQLAAVTNFARLTQNIAVTSPVTFTPSNTMHSFTISFRVRSTNSGTIAAICTGTKYATIQIQNGNVAYVSTNGQQISVSVNATNGDWHDVALAYRYALTNTTLFVDGNLAGNLQEQYVPSQFILGGPAGAPGQPASPLVADYQNWCVYRAAWNINEAQAQQLGNRQQASMEICAALDDTSFTSGSAATNRAQSLSVAMVNTANLAAMQEASPPGNLAAQAPTTSSVKLTWTRNSATETGFVVERRLAGTSQSWAVVATLPAGSTTFTDISPAIGVAYQYRVAAQEGGIQSSYSNIVSIAPGNHQDILIDFGPNDDTNGDFVASPDYLGQNWNDMYGPGGGSASVIAGSGITALITTNDVMTTIGLTIGGGFAANGIQNGGLLTPSYSLLGNLAVTNATEKYFFTTVTAALAITNLDPTAIYQFRLFGTRNTGTGSSRITAYTVTGGNGSITTNLTTSGLTWINNSTNYYGNDNTIAKISGVTPDGNNQIQLGLSSVAGGFAYLGIMEITVDHPPVAENATYYRLSGSPVQIYLTNLFTNVTDVDGDSITLTGVGAGTNGAAILTNATSISYMPGSGANSNQNDSFTYTVSDGYGGSATANINVIVYDMAGQSQIGVRGDGSVNIKFFGVPAYNYVVETATNLSGQWWPLATNMPGSDGSWIFTDPRATNAQQYYRIAQP